MLEGNASAVERNGPRDAEIQRYTEKEELHDVIVEGVQCLDAEQIAERCPILAIGQFVNRFWERVVVRHTSGGWLLGADTKVDGNGESNFAENMQRLVACKVGPFFTFPEIDEPVADELDETENHGTCDKPNHARVNQ